MSRRAARGPRVEGQFIPPMLLQPTTSLPSGDAWLHELETPVLVGQFEFLEWTADDHLRHSKLVALSADARAT